MSSTLLVKPEIDMPTAHTAAVEALCVSMRAALTGGRDLCSTPLNPALAAVLSRDATFRPVSITEGLWAVIRAAPGTTAQVMCVHNMTDRPAAFAPTGHLTDEAERTRPLRFLHGSARTSEGPEGRLVCHLEPYGFVWLAHLPAEAQVA